MHMRAARHVARTGTKIDSVKRAVEPLSLLVKQDGEGCKQLQ